MRMTASPFWYVIESKAWLACSTVSMRCTTGCEVARESRAIASSRSPTASRAVFHCGRSFAVVRPAIQEAKPSLSQRSSHQAIVTRSPNHWCEISCAATENTACLSSWVEIEGSMSR
jgi:hypothetical protein